MKTSNPKNRYSLSIGKFDKVLEVGGGHNPHPRSNVVVDKFITSNYHRQSDLIVYRHQQFINADGENLPFANDQFDYVICNQVLEHVEDPVSFLNEQSRVAKRGYIETPSLIGEYLFPKKSHKWLILELDNKLIMVDKEKYWFSTEIDFGFLFLTWLQKTSLAYKLLTSTRPDIMTTRHEWEGEIDYIINPGKEEYLKYFKGYWDEKMVKQFFPETSLRQEIKAVMLAFISLIRGKLRTQRTSASAAGIPRFAPNP
ncbi:MAG TPA: methyltransferase domain-containing protein [Bacteroidales bacterium]|nr:methyltransferase domain-containing protein [Bacteroidales bacterium]